MLRSSTSVKPQHISLASFWWTADVTMKFTFCCHCNFSLFFTFLSTALFALWSPDNGSHYCVDVVDSSAGRGQRLGPKNTQPLAFLLTVASHGTVLSAPASEQQAGHSIPSPLLCMHMGLRFHEPWNTTLACRLILCVADTTSACPFLLYVCGTWCIFDHRS